MKPTSNITNGEMVNYMECRFDELAAQIDALHPKATPTPSPTPEPTPTATPSPTPTSEPTPAPGTTCTDENAFVNWAGETYIWDHNGAGGLGYPHDGIGYYAMANWWNTGGYNYAQHTVICDYNSWYARATADNTRGDGAVKSYPNVHVDTAHIPAGEKAWSQYQSVTSQFAHESPGQVGIYNVAYDVWFNGLGIELMIWTENFRQVPSGSKVATISWEGTTWDVWATSTNHYIALVPVNGGIVTSGHYDLLALFRQLNGLGRLSESAVMTQIGYGVEIVSTGGNPERFDFTDFKVDVTG